MTPAALTIDDLARQSGLPSRTIRFYQSKGLLPRPEMHGRVAHYGAVHVERLRRIADLQDRGLQIKAIQEILGRVERGETRLEEWLGLEDRLREPWANDEARVVDLGGLAALAGALRPGRLAELVRHGLVVRKGGAFLVPSPALLHLALRLEAVGVDLESTAALQRTLRKRLSRTAEDLAEPFLSRRARKGAGKGTPPLAELLRELRPAALDAVRLVFAQEMEKVLRAWVDSGKAARLGR
ncbi:MAG TPA: MerR family transcriptional regulator [Anaeromyxobacteraceae bacterium]|nr:MerR family transcriptional regulator [Anaeromyxobacteraceae bacterium]